MTIMDEDADLDAALDEITAPEEESKGAAVPLKRTPKQAAKAAALAKEREEAKTLAVQNNAAKAQAAQLAQIVNLHIAGYSLAEIGASIGATADEVDKMLTEQTARYVRTQPALRVFVRNWISSKYMAMIDADWEAASDATHRDKLENQDRVVRMLDRMAKLHGADAPTQAEVAVTSTPEAVESLVARLAASQGMGYDASVFDTVPGTVVHAAAEQAVTALEVSGNALEEEDPDGDESL